MKKKQNIRFLLIDDHPIILEGYKNVLSKLEQEEDYSVFIDTAENCNTAWEMLHQKTYQIVFLDINFPVEEDSKFLSGEDLGIRIKEEFSQIKIIISTVLEDAFRIHNLLVNVDPAGFLLKGETTSKELLRCVEKVLEASPYYGSKITKLLRSEFNQKDQVDDLDRAILYQLSLGTTTKDLPHYVPLSLRTIEDRKRKLKKIFKVNGKGNRALLEKARESGYI